MMKMMSKEETGNIVSLTEYIVRNIVKIDNLSITYINKVGYNVKKTVKK